MREFILYSRKGHTGVDFSTLRDAGRLDVVHECIVASLFLSHGLRKDVVFNAVLNGPPNPPLQLRAEGALLHDVRTDQETWNQILKKILSGKTHPGLCVMRASFESLVKEKATNSKIFVLEEGGKNIEDTDLGTNPVFVLGDHIGLPKTVEKFVLRHGEKISLARQAYLAATCITILNYIVDKRMAIDVR